METTQERVEYNLKPWQDGFMFDPAKYHFLKSAWGTGKTHSLVLGVLNECDRIPGNEVLVCQKEFTDLRDTTIKDFERVSGEELDGSRNLWRNDSLVMFRHLEELSQQNLQNMNLGAFFIDQAEFLDNQEVFDMLCGRLRRTRYSTKELAYIKSLPIAERQEYYEKDYSCKGYVVSNANGHNWIYKIKTSGIYAYDNDGKKTDKRIDAHWEATTFDNKDNLRDDFFTNIIYPLKDRNPARYNRFVLNSDEEADTVDTIIKYEWIQKAINKVLPLTYPRTRLISVDPGRYGDDEHVIYCIENGKIKESEIYDNKSSMEDCGRAVRMKEKTGANLIDIDVCGLGGPVADRLIELGERPLQLNSATTEKVEKKYKNLRAAMWSYSARRFENGTVSIPADDKLIEELKEVRYKTIESNGRMQVESKEDLRKSNRLGRSPGRADALIMGLWSEQFAEPLRIESSRKLGQSSYVPEPC